MSQIAFDEEKAKKFGQRYIEDVGAMMLGCMTYIGQELDLFTQMSKFESFTSEELANAASCNERYIREWLSALTCAGWIEFDKETKKWSFPAEHQLFLINRDTKDYCGGALNVIQPFYTVAPKMIQCFRNGGGLSLDEIHPNIGLLVEQMTKPSQRHLVPRFIEEYLPDVHSRLNDGINVADVGCGTGNCLIALSKKYPNSKFWGFEPHAPSLLRAKANLLEAGCNNVTLVESTSAGVESNFFDFITSWDVVHDLSSPLSFLADVYRGLKSDGVYLMNEVDAHDDLGTNFERRRTFIYSLSTMYCLTVSLSGGGPGYGACMGEKIPEKLCREVGFTSFIQLPSPSRLYRISKQ